MSDFVLTDELRHELYDRALANRLHAYVPYSKFHVGAALLTEDGRIFDGANMENASYGATICAERVAMVKAIYEGSRSFNAIAVASDQDEALPCGICRQFMAEFNDGSMYVITGRDRWYRLDDLLPHMFRFEDGVL